MFSSLHRGRRQRKKNEACTSFRLTLECLEDRYLPSTITVANNADSGAGSLRAALASAASGDTINFSSTGLTGGQTITLTSGTLAVPVNVTVTDAGAPAVAIVSATTRVFNFSVSTLTAVTLQDLTIQGAASDGSTGGAIRSSTNGPGFTLTIDTCAVTGALTVATRGGAISITGNNDSLVITNSTIVGTVTTAGTFNNDAGAIYVATNKSVSISDSTLSGTVSGGGSGANYGGAVYQNSGTLTLTDCTLSGSSVTGAKANGGAFDIQGGTATFTGCTISGNSASHNGGGLYVGKGTLNLLNCTITGNSAGNDGGGVAAFFYSSNSQNGSATTSLTNCTISGNTATAGAGLYVGYHQHSTTTSTNTVTARNTIIAGGIARQTGGSITDAKEQFNATNSLFDSNPTTGAGNTINGTNSSNLFGMDPQLSTLVNNGGPTNTLALASTSPAIDAGNDALASALTTDQRGTGFPRVLGAHVDIGAYEFDAPPVVATTASALVYLESQSAHAIDTGLTVTAGDQANLSAATVQVSGNYASGQDVLAFTTQNGITGSFNAATGVLALAGTASAANYQTALQSVTFVTTSDTPTFLVRTISFGVSDGIVTSASASRAITVTPSLDVDGNGTAEALTDGILILRYMFAFSGPTLTSGVLGAGATRTDPTAIHSYLDSIRATVLDVDSNGTPANALTDGILLLRYLFKFTGTTLTSGALAAGATCTDPTAITAFLDAFNPSVGHLWADTTGPGAAPQAMLTTEELQVITAAAIARWETADLTSVARARLECAQVQVADLGGTALGATYGNVVLIDRDAAQNGWFIDPTPLDDTEFTFRADSNQSVAPSTSPATGRMDLLTVVMHELGLVMGLQDIDPGVQPNTLMTDVLGVGVRRVPS